MKYRITIAGAAMVLALAWSPASAGFWSHEVWADYHFPDLGTVYLSSGPATVGSGVEFDNIGGFGIGVSPAVDFSDTNILLTYPVGWSLAGTGTFDGWVFGDGSATVPEIVAVSLAGTNIAGLTQSNLSFDADHVYLNQLGLGSWGVNSFVSMDVSFVDAVPEPKTAFLMLGGMALAGLLALRRRMAGPNADRRDDRQCRSPGCANHRGYREDPNRGG